MYVPGSRGRDANTFYVVCRQAPEHHDPERIDSTPVAVLTDIVTPPSTPPRPPNGRRAAVEEPVRWPGSAPNGPADAEYGRHRATDTLTELVGPDLARRAIGKPGYGRLMSAVRSMELAGHDPRAVLTEAVARGSLPHAHSVSDMLGYHIRLLDNGGRTPERAVRGGLDHLQRALGRSGRRLRTVLVAHRSTRCSRRWSTWPIVGHRRRTRASAGCPELTVGLVVTLGDSASAAHKASRR